MEEAKAQLESIDDEMEEEIQRARERLAKMQESKHSFRQLYEGAARLLGIEIENEETEEKEALVQNPVDEESGQEKENQK